MKLWPLVALLALACGMRRAPTPAAPFRVPHAPDTITRVQIGMSQVEVQSLLGSPDALEYGLTHPPPSEGTSNHQTCRSERRVVTDGVVSALPAIKRQMLYRLS